MYIWTATWIFMEERGEKQLRFIPEFEIDVKKLCQNFEKNAEFLKKLQNSDFFLRFYY